MLHTGLWTGEVRRLRQADLATLASLSAGLKGGRVRIEQSNGLRDHIVYLSSVTVATIGR